jgi:hypothetical protein
MFGPSTPRLPFGAPDTAPASGRETARPAGWGKWAAAMATPPAAIYLGSLLGGAARFAYALRHHRRFAYRCPRCGRRGWCAPLRTARPRSA